MRGGPSRSSLFDGTPEVGAGGYAAEQGDDGKDRWAHPRKPPQRQESAMRKMRHGFQGEKVL